MEGCIYGVDLNPLAVELAKLSLWLTCIAADEPLNFLDHHLRPGNSLLFARAEELSHSPRATAEQRAEPPVFPKNDLLRALAAVIKENVDMERTASTEMELVKPREQRWKQIRARLQPFLDAADIWLGAFDDVPLDEWSYRLLVRGRIAPDGLTPQEKTDAQQLRDSLAGPLAAKVGTLQPLHWELEFPEVFFQADGAPQPEAQRGFDAILGNPPYISPPTPAARSAGAQRWRNGAGSWKTFTSTSPSWASNCFGPAAGSGSSFPTPSLRWKASDGCASRCKATRSRTWASATHSRPRSMPPWLSRGRWPHPVPAIGSRNGVRRRRECRARQGRNSRYAALHPSPPTRFKTPTAARAPGCI